MLKEVAEYQIFLRGGGETKARPKTIQFLALIGCDAKGFYVTQPETENSQRRNLGVEAANQSLRVRLSPIPFLSFFLPNTLILRLSYIVLCPFGYLQ